MDNVTVKAIYPIYNSGKGPPYACQSLLRAMRTATFDIEFWAEQFAPAVREKYGRVALPFALFRLYCRLGLVDRPGWGRLPRRALERRYAAELKQGDLAYLWPAVTPECYHDVKASGVPMVVERINCHRATSVQLLDEAYARLGWPCAHSITADDTDAEDEKMALADHIFAPSPNVADSLLQAGIPEKKILRTSYGWEPARFRGGKMADPSGRGPVFLFVGRGCVRKGLPWLLRMWAGAEIKGRLVLCLFGPMDNDVAERCAGLLGREDVFVLGRDARASEAYRMADVLVFPTHEEGSPLVTYEALGCSLPCIMSPMAAGEVVRDGKEGFVIDPYEVDAWIDRMRLLAGDSDLRRTMSAAARERAEFFTWENVGARRREQLLQVLNAEG